jgi:hypothetical protein
MIEIYYGGSGILAYPTGYPKPLFSETENAVRYGGKWCTTTTITLNGQLSGCTYDAIQTAKSRLENIYSKDFQSLLIIQDGRTYYDSYYNIIREIDFQQSRYIGLLDYSVSLESYPRELFSGYFGVIEPVNEWNFSEDNNQLLIVNHRVSAKGIQTSNSYSNSFDNAKNYVLSLTGSSSFISPYFTNHCTGVSLCLDTFSENIDRFNCTFGIEEKYYLDPLAEGSISPIIESISGEYASVSISISPVVDGDTFLASYTDNGITTTINIEFDNNSSLNNPSYTLLDIGIGGDPLDYGESLANTINLILTNAVCSFNSSNSLLTLISNNQSSLISVNLNGTSDTGVTEVIGTPASIVYNNRHGYIRYTTDYSCDALRGAATLSINGEVKSCKNVDLDTLRSKYQSFDVYSAAVRAYYESCGRLDLNRNFLFSGITEDQFSKKINFNVSFDNDFNPRTFLEYETSIKLDDQDITTVGVKGTIKSRGDLKNKYSLVENYYNTQLNLYYLAYQSYNEFYNNAPVYPLRNQQLNYSISKNQFVGEISVSTEYDNKDLIPPEFQSLDYNISVTPAIRQIRALPLVKLDSPSLCSGNWYCSDLGFNNRAQIQIAGRAVGTCTGNATTTLTGIRNLGNYWLTNLYNNDRTFLDKNSIVQTNEGKGNSFSFNFGWSFDATQSANTSPWNWIETLSLK